MTDLGKIAYVPKGDYNAASQYEYLDVVYYNGASYSAKQSTTGHAPTTGRSDDVYWQLMVSSAAGVIKPLGTITFANLPSNPESGDSYNISDNFTTDNRFKEGSGVPVQAGANVYYTADGYWDILAGKPIVNIINGMKIDGTENVNNYGVCSTAAGTAAKTVSIVGNYSLVTGAEVTVKFTNNNTASNPTLNVNSTGAKAIYYSGAAIAGNKLKAGVYTFRYNGTQWDLAGSVGSGHTIKNESGTEMTTREGLKFANCTVTDSSANDETIVTPNGEKVHVFDTLAQAQAAVQAGTIKNGEQAWVREDGTMVQVSDLQQGLVDLRSSLATVESSTTASKAYVVGEFMLFNGKLYRVTTAIASGGTITVGTNITADTVGAELKSINTTLANKQDKLTNPLTKADVVNNLTSTTTNVPLSAAQGKALNDAIATKQDKLTNPLTKSDVVNNLTTTTTNVPLSAAQGKALNDNKQPKTMSKTIAGQTTVEGCLTQLNTDIISADSYATCSTARSTAAKVVALTGFTLKTGATIKVRFTDTGTSNPSSGNLTLNVNSTGAKTIVDGHSNNTTMTYANAGYFYNNMVCEFVYNGTSWVWLNRDTNTTYTGATMKTSVEKTGSGSTVTNTIATSTSLNDVVGTLLNNDYALNKHLTDTTIGFNSLGAEFYDNISNTSFTFNGRKWVTIKARLKVTLAQGGDYTVGNVTGSAIPNDVKYGHFETLSGYSGVAWIQTNGTINFHLALVTLTNGDELVFKFSY